MRPAVLFIMLTVMIDAMGIGLIIPVMPDLLREINGSGLSEAAIWGGILATSFAVMQFLFGPVLGGLSDRFGRRPVLLVSLIVMAFDYVVMAMTHGIWLLLAARLIGGITAATNSTASAYMADISTGEERTKNFGLIGAAFGMGFVLGPVVGGLLAEFGSRAPFWAAAVLSFANAILGWIVLKETVTADKVRAFSWRRANPLGSIRQLGQLPGVRRLLFVYFLYHFAFSAYTAVWAYFGQERFDWSPAIIGVSLASFGISMALVQGLVVRLSLRRFRESGTVLIGHVFALVTYLGIALIDYGIVILLMTPVAALGGLVPVALQGMMSNRVSDNAQGELQGALTSATSLAMILSPLTMTAAFAYFTTPNAPIYLPGAPFMLAFALIAGALVIFLTRKRQTDITSSPT